MKKYTVCDVTGEIVGYADRAREADHMMRQYTCPMRRYLSSEIPALAHQRGCVSGALSELIAADESR
jgi:hypothetical protein